uniref:C2H2-type domain-containing protein n=1 Tax=Plectus sambesii TaxID=2011161 RepID=A0A914W397_9BILA
MDKTAKDASYLNAIGICEIGSPNVDNDSAGHEKNAQSATEQSTKTPDASNSKKAPKARKSFGVSSSKRASAVSPPSLSPAEQAVDSTKSTTTPAQSVLRVIPLVVNAERRAAMSMQMKSTGSSPSVAASMSESRRIESFNSAKEVKTENMPSPSCSNAVAAENTTSLFSNGGTKGDKSAITVTAGGQTVRVVRLPAGNFRINPQREVLLNGLLERKMAALKSQSAQMAAKRSLSPAKPHTSPPKKKRNRKSEGAERNHKKAEPDVPVEPPPRRDGRPRRSAAPKSFKSSLNPRAYEEEATTSDSDDNREKPRAEEKAKAVGSASQSTAEGVVRPLQQQHERPLQDRPLTAMTVMPRVLSASPAGFDKSVEQLLLTPLSLFQCQLCGIYLPKKDVTLNHIKRTHRVEDDQRAANNCIMVKKDRALAPPLSREPLHLRKIADAASASVSTTSKVVPTTAAEMSPTLERADEVKITAGTGIRRANLTSKYRCQQCRKLFDNRQSAQLHHELVHS